VAIGRGGVEVDGRLGASLGDPACLVDRCQPRAMGHLLVEDYRDRLRLTRGEGHAGLLVRSGAEVARTVGELQGAGGVDGLPAGVVDLRRDHKLAAGGPGPSNRGDVEVHRRRAAGADVQVNPDADAVGLNDVDAAAGFPEVGFLCPDHAVKVPWRGGPWHLDGHGDHGPGVGGQGHAVSAQGDPCGQVTGGLADVANERPGTDDRGVRVDRYASGRGSEVGDLDPPVNRRARVQMVDNVPIGPRVVGFINRDVSEPDAEYRRRRLAHRLGRSGERCGERGGGHHEHGGH